MPGAGGWDTPHTSRSCQCAQGSTLLPCPRLHLATWQQQDHRRRSESQGEAAAAGPWSRKHQSWPPGRHQPILSKPSSRPRSSDTVQITAAQPWPHNLSRLSKGLAAASPTLLWSGPATMRSQQQGHARWGPTHLTTWWQQLHKQREQPLRQKKGVTALRGGEPSRAGRPEHIQ